jgi:hypothetical protein
VGIFLNAGLVRTGEAGTIEDEDQEHRNNKAISKRQGSAMTLLFFIRHTFDTCNNLQISSA